ncbi:MAG: N-acetylglucosamine-6-phosphate deacetylase [Solirubrobacteraceae bacterium]
MRLGVARALLDDGSLVGGDVRIADGRIAEIALQPAGRSGIAAPGFVDVQVNGFGGVDALSAEPEDFAQMGAALAAHGVTAFMPTLVSAPEDDLARALGAIDRAGELPGGVRLLGAHLEGPFLSPEWPGAHDPEQLRACDLELLERLCAAGPVRAVTLAPELDGAMELIDALCEGDVCVRLGHTDADAATCHAAFERGAVGLTHAFNAHRRFAPRDPGPVGAAIARDGIFLSAIVDGMHLAGETAALLWRATDGRLCLISDAVAVGADGAARLGGREATLADGAARLSDGRLAGSLGALDEAVRRLVELGAPFERALHAASTAPARFAGRPDLGTLTVGYPADVVVLDDDLNVVRTLVGGEDAGA